MVELLEPLSLTVVEEPLTAYEGGGTEAATAYKGGGTGAATAYKGG